MSQSPLPDIPDTSRGVSQGGSPVTPTDDSLDLDALASLGLDVLAPSPDKPTDDSRGGSPATLPSMDSSFTTAPTGSNPLPSPIGVSRGGSPVTLPSMDSSFTTAPTGSNPLPSPIGVSQGGSSVTLPSMDSSPSLPLLSSKSDDFWEAFFFLLNGPTGVSQTTALSTEASSVQPVTPKNITTKYSYFLQDDKTLGRNIRSNVFKHHTDFEVWFVLIHYYLSPLSVKRDLLQQFYYWKMDSWLTLLAENQIEPLLELLKGFHKTIRDSKSMSIPQPAQLFIKQIEARGSVKVPKNAHAYFLQNYDGKPELTNFDMSMLLAMAGLYFEGNLFHSGSALSSQFKFISQSGNSAAVGQAVIQHNEEMILYVGNFDKEGYTQRQFGKWTLAVKNGYRIPHDEIRKNFWDLTKETFVVKRERQLPQPNGPLKRGRQKRNISEKTPFKRLEERHDRLGDKPPFDLKSKSMKPKFIAELINIVAKAFMTIEPNPMLQINKYFGILLMRNFATFNSDLKKQTGLENKEQFIREYRNRQRIVLKFLRTIQETPKISEEDIAFRDFVFSQELDQSLTSWDALREHFSKQDIPLYQKDYTLGTLMTQVGELLYVQFDKKFHTLSPWEYLTVLTCFFLTKIGSEAGDWARLKLRKFGLSFLFQDESIQQPLYIKDGFYEIFSRELSRQETIGDILDGIDPGTLSGGGEVQDRPPLPPDLPEAESTGVYYPKTFGKYSVSKGVVYM